MHQELNLEELYKLKDLNHNDIRIWVLNNTNQRGLAAKIRDCLEKGYHIGDKHIKGDYNILKQDNFDGSWRDGLKTEIFVHVDTINNPHEANNLMLDCAKSKEKLGWLSKWDIETALTFTIKWYRSVIDNPNTALEISNEQIFDYLKS